MSWSHTVSIVLDFVDVSVRGGYDAPGRVHDCGRLGVGSRVEAPFSGTVGHANGMKVVVGRAKVKGLSIIGQNGLAGLYRTPEVVSPT